MKQFILSLCFLFIVQLVCGQTNIEQYNTLIKKADSFYLHAQYDKAVIILQEAFEVTGGMGKVRDRYKMAICWVKLGKIDNAFIQLERIATKGNFKDPEMLEAEPDFKILQKDAERWKKIIDRVKSNKKGIIPD
jgi:hypothetical protein